jgi:hypothetical protein
MVAGNALDVMAGNAQVAQLARIKSGQLTHGLLVSGPLLQSLTNTHWDAPYVVDPTYLGEHDADEQTQIRQPSHALFAWDNSGWFTPRWQLRRACDQKKAA